jgi:hypothetical protein
MKLNKDKEIDFMIQVQVIINKKLNKNKNKIKIKATKNIINDFFTFEFIFMKFDQY